MSLNREQASLYWTPQRAKNFTSKKPWLIQPPQDMELLYALGLMGRSGEINHSQAKKIAQINHMIQILAPNIQDLCNRMRVIRILDAGCGTSSLSIILGWILKNKWKTPFQISGVDSNPKVIESSRQRADILGLSDDIEWEVSTIQNLLEKNKDSEEKKLRSDRYHVVLALHACDTATDQALAFGLFEEAELIAVAPCCHRELAQFWKTNESILNRHSLRLAFKNPQIRHEIAAHFTDALRLGYMRSRGYEVTSTEFVPSSHTPKNRLIMCERRGKYHSLSLEEYQESKKALGDPFLALEAIHTETMKIEA
jgi:SAM-dependent methyltransferase